MKAALFSLLAVPALAAPGRITEHFARDGQSPMDVPQQVVVEKTGYSGNGCPQGTVSTLISDDRTVVTFGFDSFQAAIGPSVSAANKQKNCQLHLGLRYPSGFQLSILQATYHGYVRLDEGVTANFISSYYFSQDASHTATSHTVLRGPEFAAGKTYTKSDNVESSAVVWSPCGANGILNVNNRIALTSNPSNGTGEISNDDATLKFTQKLRIAWKRCNPGDVGYDGPIPDDSSSGSYGSQSGSYGGQPGSYSTFTSGGFGGFTDGQSQWGSNPGYQVYGPGGQPYNGGYNGGGFTSTITRPVESNTETE